MDHGPDAGECSGSSDEVCNDHSILFTYLYCNLYAFRVPLFIPGLTTMLTLDV